MSLTNVSILSTFGSAPRGVSSYSEGLMSGLKSNGLVPGKLDYQQLYPEWLVPAEGMSSISVGGEAVVHWARPSTWKQAAELSANLLHIQYWSPVTAYMLYVICRHLHALGKKVVVTIHNPKPHEHLPVVHQIERALIQSADGLIVHSEQGRTALLSSCKDLNPATIFVIPHGINVRIGEPGTAADYKLSALHSDRRYVLMFGNLRGYKGVTTLLKAWKRVVESVQDVDLVIAGRLWRGQETLASRAVAKLLKTKQIAREISNMLDAPGLSGRVILDEGLIQDCVIDAYCRTAVLGVFPYDRFSGQSGAATRAAGWGLPLIVSDVGALPLLVAEGVQLINPRDSGRLANNLIALLQDPEKLARIRVAQNRLTEAVSWQEVGKQHIAVYKKYWSPLSINDNMLRLRDV